jgi:hypothetical protein
MIATSSHYPAAARASACRSVRLGSASRLRGGCTIGKKKRVAFRDDGRILTFNLQLNYVKPA